MKNRKAEVGQRIPVTLGNIAPLSLTPFRPGRMALVCEGGGQRGIFTAGVLDEFMHAQFNPFHLYFGTSAGAQNLSAYLCNQPGYGRKVIMRYTTRREFLIRCDLYAEETLLTSTGWWNPPPPGCRCRWIPQRACSTAENPFICAPAGGMITRRAISRRQNKTGLISFAPPAPYRVSTVPALR